MADIGPFRYLPAGLSTVYAILTLDEQSVTTSGTLVTLSPATWVASAQPMSDPNSSSYYKGTIPVQTPVGTYQTIIFLQAGSSPAVTDAEIGRGETTVTSSSPAPYIPPANSPIPLATVDYANSYFASRLHSSAWFDSTSEDQYKGLVTSTRALNRLDYKGWKYLPDQLNEWPRRIPFQPCPCYPDAIQAACCENALRLLDGFDIELERRNFNVTSRGYSSVRTSYDSKFPPPYINAGIASATAWDLLLPWFRDQASIVIRRV